MALLTSPPARRTGSARRDLRLALGVGLVVASVVVGSRVLAAADHRVPVWSAASALSSGTTLRAEDLVAIDVSLDDLAAYAGTDQDLVGRRLAHDLGAGELVPTAALTSSTDDRRMVTVAVDPLHTPPSLARGERVDVYVTPKDGASVGNGAVQVVPTLVLAGALVADPGRADESGASSQVGVVLDVAATDADRAVAAARGGDVDLVRVGAGS